MAASCNALAVAALTLAAFSGVAGTRRVVLLGTPIWLGVVIGAILLGVAHAVSRGSTATAGHSEDSARRSAAAALLDWVLAGQLVAMTATLWSWWNLVWLAHGSDPSVLELEQRIEWSCIGFSTATWTLGAIAVALAVRATRESGRVQWKGLYAVPPVIVGGFVLLFVLLG